MNMIQRMVRLDQFFVRYSDFDVLLFLISVAIIDHVLVLMRMVLTFLSSITNMIRRMDALFLLW